VANDSNVGVFAAGRKVFALRDSEDVKERRENALVKREQSGGGAFSA
jgi:hypothetical protein